MKLFKRILDRNIYQGEVVKLKEKFRTSHISAFDGVPTVYYDIYDSNDNKVGTCELRLTADGEMYYYGHIGYNIIEKYRGHNYAYYACKVLFIVAREEFNMKELIITCSPDNIASYKTLEKLNGKFIEQINVPINHELYKNGEKIKCIFKYQISL